MDVHVGTLAHRSVTMQQRTIEVQLRKDQFVGIIVGKVGIARNCTRPYKKHLNNNRWRLEIKQEERLTMVRNPIKLHYCQWSKSIDKRDNNYMIIDSGALEHVISDVGLFQKIMEVDEVEVELADGSTDTFKYRGKALVDTGMKTVVLSSVFFIPNL